MKEIKNSLKYIEIVKINESDNDPCILLNNITNEYFQMGKKETQLLISLKKHNVQFSRKVSIDLYGKDVVDDFILALNQNGILETQKNKEISFFSINESIIYIHSLKNMLNNIHFNKLGILMMYLLIILPIIFGSIAIYQRNLFSKFNDIDLSLTSIIIVLILLLITFTIHEFGHAFFLRRYSKQVNAIAIKLKYIVLPTFFVDASETYKIRKKRHKLSIALGGTYFQLSATSLIVLALLYFNSFNNIFILQFYMFISLFTVVYNLIPFEKMDGYWILISILNINNFSYKSRNAFKKFITNSNENNGLSDITSNNFYKLLIILYGFLDIIFNPLCVLIILSLSYLIINNTLSLFAISIFLIINIYKILKFIITTKKGGE